MTRRKTPAALFGLLAIVTAGLNVQGPAQAAAAAPAGAPVGAGRGAFNPNPTPQTIRLWEGAAPGALGQAPADIPTLTIYRPSTGAAPGNPAVVVAPGGGYFLDGTIGMEGDLTAYWLASIGITAFVLKYRLIPYHYPAQIDDGKRAVRLVRARASEFGVNPDRIGMLGFSAGGHLASATGTMFDAGDPTSADPVERVSSRPDFLVLNYPVISFRPEIAGPSNLTVYANSGRNLLGDNPDPKLVQDMSTETRVTAQTPPTFLYAGSADRLVPAENAAAFYLALIKAGVPAEMHIFETAGHGRNLADPNLGEWGPLLINWLRGEGIIGSVGTRGITIGGGAGRGGAPAAAPQGPGPAAGRGGN